MASERSVVLDRVLRYRTSLTLIVVTVATLVLAILVYPDTSSTATPQPYSVIVNAQPSSPPFVYRSVAVHLERAAGTSDAYVLVATITGTGNPSGAVVTVRLPKGATVRCKDDGQSCTTSSVGGVPSVTFGCFTAFLAPCLGFSASKPLRFTAAIDGVLLGWSTTNVSAIAQLPSVDTASAPGATANACGAACPADMAFTVIYDVPDGGYDWANGPPPLHDSPLTWRGALAGWSAIVITGTNNDAASSVADDQFYAAALLGIAGGALIGSIQEFMDTEADAREEESTEHDTSAAPAV